MEKWKIVEGYPNHAISSYGNIKNINYRGTGKERYLRPKSDKDGYSVVNLYCDGKVRTLKIHRLVAQAFIPNINGLPMINHKDENRANNHSDNLEWCDAKYNTNYGNCIDKSSSARSKPVICVETGKTYKNAMMAAKELGADFSTLYKVLRGEHGRRTCCGFHWAVLSNTMAVTV